MPTRTETVERVIAGDTFTTKARKRAVRLLAVSVPETTTPLGKQAAAELQALIGGKKVEVQAFWPDVYGRILASVELDGKSINAEMHRRLSNLQ